MRSYKPEWKAQIIYQCFTMYSNLWLLIGDVVILGNLIDLVYNSRRDMRLLYEGLFLKEKSFYLLSI